MSRPAPSGNAMQSHFNKFKSDMQKKLHEKNQFNDTLERIEQKTGIDRFYMVVGKTAVFSQIIIACSKNFCSFRNGFFVCAVYDLRRNG